MIKLGNLLYVVLFAGAHYAAGAPNSGYQYSREVNAWLRLHMVPATWAEAGMRCLLEGGTLASPTTNAMAQVMVAMMDDHKLTRSVFTGINSILVRENFTSLEGVPLSSIPVGWAAGQPDNENSDEECVALTGAAQLEDVSCGSMLPYFCKKPSKSPNCGDGEHEYNMVSRTGSCYKFNREPKSWRNALATCYAQGGYLAIINSKTESTVLKEILAVEKKGGYTYVGFMKYADGVWATINGDTLAEAGFQEWAPQEPNNAAGIETCGSIFASGLLNDAQCVDPRAFMCEFTL
ncbi:pulmonary surfactant-associated protein D-like [Cydia pomonella]|uniref:pulmonary surfactant-associated protein D-like n=1 Tax=Cydia pomonella TaxID=82600 RepID=UPI002ADE54BB|nr:pulmonary surfactant-associated protein D-like [Cydia pomonella]